MKFDLPSDDGSADDEAIDEVEGDTIAVNKVDSA